MLSVTEQGAALADVLIVGAGLAGGFVALSLREKHPSLRIVLLEKEAQIEKQRTWSFHASDLGEAPVWLKPLLRKTWDSYDIRLPALERRIQTGYASIRPVDLEAHLREVFGSDLRFQQKIKALTPNSVETESGEKIEARLVIDARGARVSGPVGYQKFTGLSVQLSAPHGLTRPLLMDAQVPQTDGYRFFYLLPWSETELLVEDTRYSSSPNLDPQKDEAEILAYISKRKWQVKAVQEREHGVLPIPLTSPLLPQALEAAPSIGMAAGFFHPVTGYSLPDAVRVAERLAGLPLLNHQSVHTELREYVSERQGLIRYLCFLNRMMFLAAKPELRYRVFEHFYRLSEPAIQRFYRGELAFRDRLRLLWGEPPVPVLPAMRSIFHKGESL